MAVPSRLRSLGRFAWLYSPGHTELPAPTLDEFRAGSDFVLKSWQVTGVVAPKLLEWGSEFRDDAAAQQVRDRMTSMSALAARQFALCHRLTAAYEDEGIPYSLLKGSATRLTAYASPDLRCGHDIDLGVQKEDLDRAQEISAQLGFERSQWNHSTKRFEPADPDHRARVEAEHYELGFLVYTQVPDDLSPDEEAAIRRDLRMWHVNDDDRVSCYIRIDVHHGMSLDIGLDDMLATSRRASSGGYTATVPAPEWILFHIIYKIYWEGVHHYHRKRNGYQYADLSRQLAIAGSETFGRLCELLSEHYLDAAAHYVLRRLPSDLHLPLTPEQAAYVQRTAIPPQEADPIHWNDLGDMWPRLWGHR